MSTSLKCSYINFAINNGYLFIKPDKILYNKSYLRENYEHAKCIIVIYLLISYKPEGTCWPPLRSELKQQDLE